MEYIAREPPIKKEFQDVIIPHIPPTITTFAMIFIQNAVPIASAVTSPVASCDFMIAPESRTSPTAIITSA